MPGSHLASHLAVATVEARVGHIAWLVTIIEITIFLDEICQGQCVAFVSYFISSD